MHTSSRNSEVIHSGLYYEDEYLKTKLCLAGKSLLYSYLEKNNIAHKRCGKVLFAQKENLDKLNFFYERMKTREIQAEFLTKERLKDICPILVPGEAVLIKDTGIVDSHDLMRSLNTKAIENGVIFQYGKEVVSSYKTQNEFHVSFDDDEYVVKTKNLINCAGLWANDISKVCGIDNKDYELTYVKGEYFKTSKLKDLPHLIYTVPKNTEISLGIHTKNNLDGSVSFGPNAFEIEFQKISWYLGSKNPDYSVDENHKKDFERELTECFDSQIDFDLSPDYSGIRPKLKTGKKDFVIKKEHNGLINLIGIESPGLTSCFAIANMVNELVHF